MDRRIAAPGTHALKTALDKLTSELPGYGFPLFDTKQKALMFAASLGRYRGRREPMDNRDSATAIRFDIFEGAMDDGFVRALAVEAVSDLKVLGTEREAELVTIFEESVHAGLIELNRLCFESNKDPFDALLQLTADCRSLAVDGDIEGVGADVLKDLMG
jgi:dnd system-associated protein 4